MEAQPVSSTPDDLDLQGFSAPTCKGRERRASLVIKETEQLLTGLAADAHRSTALMKELEALLAASQAASGQALCHSETLDIGAAAFATAHFAAVQPLQFQEVNDDADDQCNVSSQRLQAIGCRSSAVTDMDHAQDEESPRLDTPATSANRRSSVINLDGSTFFGAAGDASAPSSRAHSFTRARTNLRSSSTTWLEAPLTAATSSSFRRRSVIDVSSAAQTAAQMASHRPSGDAVLPATAVLRRKTSATDDLELVRRPPSQTSRLPSTFGAGTPDTPWPGQHAAFASSFQRQLGLSEYGADGLLSDVEAEAVHDAGTFAADGRGGSGSGEQAGRPGSRVRSGRFMRMIKGIFVNHDEDPAKGAPSTMSGFSTPPSTGQPLSPTGSGGFARGASPITRTFASGPGIQSAGPDLQQQRCAVGSDAAVSPHRGGGLVAVSTRSMARPPRRFSSFTVANSATPGMPALAVVALPSSRLAVSASVPPVLVPASNPTAAARSISTATSPCLAGSNNVSQEAVSPAHSAQLLPTAEGRALPVRSSSRASLACALPHI